MCVGEFIFKCNFTFLLLYSPKLFSMSNTEDVQSHFKTSVLCPENKIFRLFADMSVIKNGGRLQSKKTQLHQREQVCYITLQGEPGKSRDRLRLCLHVTPGFKTSVRVTLRLALCLKKKNVYLMEDFIKRFSFTFDIIDEYPIQMSDRISDLPDKLAFWCSVTFLSPLCYHAGIENLSNINNKMFESGVGADVTFRIHGHDIPAHKAILSVRCKKLAQLIRDKARDNVVEIDDTEPIFFRWLLKFLYTGQVGDKRLEVVKGLYVLSRRYELPLLRELCIEIMLSQITTFNAASFYNLADMHYDDGFVDSVWDFIKYRLSDIPMDDEWSLLPQRLLSAS